MRTTIDMPDALYRKTKAIAALRGSSVKDLIVRAVEREVKKSRRRNRRGQTLALPLSQILERPQAGPDQFRFR